MVHPKSVIMVNFVMYISSRIKKKIPTRTRFTCNGGESCDETVAEPSLYSFHFAAFANVLQ